jgi:glycosyltransferase involved in cell wall biosynthesis
VPALCDALAELGVDVHLVAGRPADDAMLCGWPADARRVHAVRESRHMRAWGIGRKVREELAKLGVGEGTLIHDHGLWLATNHAAAVFAQSRHVPRIVSTRGMLSAWSLGRGRLKKRLAWHAYQRRDLATATAFHATSTQEADEIQALGFGQPIAVIPNGITFPDRNCLRAEHNGLRTMLFLSRIHPKKGLVNLVRAWHAAAPGDEWRLVIAGPDECGHRCDVERLVGQLALERQVTFRGEVSNENKWSLYRSADVCVLPSFSENFGLVVAEALAVGTPVLTTTGAPWRELPEIGAGWQVEPSVEALGEAIRRITDGSREELAKMGRRGAEWVRRRFAWKDIAQQMNEVYWWLLNEGDTPKCVYNKQTSHCTV